MFSNRYKAKLKVVNAVNKLTINFAFSKTVLKLVIL